jgi:hypothetical protein
MNDHVGWFSACLHLGGAVQNQTFASQGHLVVSRWVRFGLLASHTGCLPCLPNRTETVSGGRFRLEQGRGSMPSQCAGLPHERHSTTAASGDRLHSFPAWRPRTNLGVAQARPAWCRRCLAVGRTPHQDLRTCAPSAPVGRGMVAVSIGGVRHYAGGESRKTYRAAIFPSRTTMTSSPV